MGLFGKKKPKRKQVTTSDEFTKATKERDLINKNYATIKPQVIKLIAKYKDALTTHASISGDVITLHLIDKYLEIYPDGFFAFADKLGLNIEPTCMNGRYASQYTYRAFDVRAKNK